MTNEENDNTEVREFKIKPDRDTKIFRLLVGIAIILLFVFMIMSQVFAWERVRMVRADLDELQELTFTSRSKANCLALYRNDVSVALGVALAANNSLWVSVATRRPAGETEEEQLREQRDNARLGHLLEASNQPLIDATAALSKYDRINPPPSVCPHPDAEEEDRAFSGGD